MEDIDKYEPSNAIPDDEKLFMQEVIKGEADLFYLDCYLTELLRKG